MIKEQEKPNQAVLALAAAMHFAVKPAMGQANSAVLALAAQLQEVVLIRVTVERMARNAGVF